MKEIIIVEGPNCTGKSTWIKKHYSDADIFKFPIGKKLKKDAIEGKKNPVEIADRMLDEMTGVVLNVVEHELEKVVFDRSWVSTLVYQVLMNGLHTKRIKKWIERTERYLLSHQYHIKYYFFFTHLYKTIDKMKERDGELRYSRKYLKKIHTFYDKVYYQMLFSDNKLYSIQSIENKMEE